MVITKTTTFNANATVKVGDNEVAYASFNGTIDPTGVPNTNYYINDQQLYKENVKAFRAAKSEFEDTVFTEADSMAVTQPVAEVGA